MDWKDFKFLDYGKKPQLQKNARRSYYTSLSSAGTEFQQQFVGMEGERLQTALNHAEKYYQKTKKRLYS